MGNLCCEIDYFPHFGAVGDYVAKLEVRARDYRRWNVLFCMLCFSAVVFENLFFFRALFFSFVECVF